MGLKKRKPTSKDIKIAITGNRNPLQSDHVIIKGVMDKIMSNSRVTEVVFGGAQGVDTVALLFALLFKQENPFHIHPRLVVMLPNTIEEQPKSTIDVTNSADEVIELCNRISPDDGFGSYRKRNEAMVQRVNRVVAFWNGVARTGTFMTINLAKSYKKQVEIIDIQGAD